MSEVAKFFSEVAENIEALRADKDVQALSRIWLREITRYKYAYNFTWMGRPIIQLPQDMVAVQELVWKYKPDVIVETGIAHGGSLIYYASLMEMLGAAGIVVGVDIDIRKHNRVEIESHSMYPRIRLVEGSSVELETLNQVKSLIEDKKRVLVILDSNHTHEHVFQELQLYAPLVTEGGYIVVMDTLIEDMPNEFFRDRPWGKGNNPKTAVHEFLSLNPRFCIDREVEAKLLITVAPDGYIKCIKD
jgi:cephalosporin hydroxylase